MARFIVVATILSVVGGVLYGFGMGIGLYTETAIKDAVKVGLIVVFSLALAAPIFLLAYRLLGREERTSQVIAVPLTLVVTIAMNLEHRSDGLAPCGASESSESVFCEVSFSAPVAPMTDNVRSWPRFRQRCHIISPAFYAQRHNMSTRAPRANGPRCGVYALVAVDAEQPFPYGFNLRDRERTDMQFQEMAGTAFEQPCLAMRKLAQSGILGTVVQVLAQKSYAYHDDRPQDEEADDGLLMHAPDSVHVATTLSSCPSSDTMFPERQAVQAEADNTAPTAWLLGEDSCPSRPP